MTRGAREALPRAREVVPGEAGDRVVLDYDRRMLRRRRLVSEGGRAFLVDLPETVALTEEDVFLLDDGTRIGIGAADEDCLEIRGDLARLAWHIGNRHAPCRIEADRLVIREDPVLARMIEGLGGSVKAVREPFRPEGGAWGRGRPMGHSHGDPEDGHSHDGDAPGHAPRAHEHRHGEAGG